MPSTEPMPSFPPEFRVNVPVPEIVLVPQSRKPVTLTPPDEFTVILESVTPAVFDIVRFPVIVVGKPLPNTCVAVPL